MPFFMPSSKPAYLLLQLQAYAVLRPGQVGQGASVTAVDAGGRLGANALCMCWLQSGAETLSCALVNISTSHDVVNACTKSQRYAPITPSNTKTTQHGCAC